MKNGTEWFQDVKLCMKNGTELNDLSTYCHALFIRCFLMEQTKQNIII